MQGLDYHFYSYQRLSIKRQKPVCLMGDITQAPFALSLACPEPVEGSKGCFQGAPWLRQACPEPVEGLSPNGRG